MRRALFFGLLFLLPTFVLVVHPELVRGAGFAKQSMFLSQSSVSQGETVFIYVVVGNDTPSYFSGTLKFSDASGPIGTAPVSLNSGVAATISVTWKPKQGKHEVVANLTTQDGQVVESESATFMINPPTQATSVATPRATSTLDTISFVTKESTTTFETSQPIAQWILKASPAVGNITTPLFNSVDSARKAGSDKLDAGNDWAQKTISKAAVAPGGWLNTIWLITTTILLYVCSALAYFLKNIGIFYPAIAVFFLYIVWRIFRLFRRRRDYY